MFYINFLHLALLSVCLLACSANELSPEEYAEYIESSENGLKISKTVGDLKFELQYRPVDYVVINEHKQVSISKSTYQQLKSEIGDMLYFNLKLSLADVNGQRDLSGNPDLESFAQFSLRNHISLSDGNGSVKPSLYHYESGHGLKPHSTIVLGFDTTQPEDADLTLIIEQVSGKIPGEVTFTIDQNDLNNIPNLKLSGS